MPQSSRRVADARRFLRDILAWALVALLAGALLGSFVTLGAGGSGGATDPALLSSVAGYLVRGSLSGEYRPLFARGGADVPGLHLVPAVAGVVLAVVGLSLGFVWVYEKLARFFLRVRLPAPARLALDGLAVGLLGLALMGADANAGRAILGTGRTYALDVASGARAAAFVLVKILATCATIGTGNVAGFVLPTVILGAFTGHLAALEAAQRASYDLAVVDRMMPRMDGDELLRRLRAEPATERLPVILLTSLAADAQRVEGINAGADDYLAKPFHPPELLARARRLIERSRPQQTRVIRRA